MLTIGKSPDLIKELFRISPIIITIIPIFLGGLTFNLELIIFAIGAFLCEFLNHYEKSLVLYLCKKFNLSDSFINNQILRPEGAIQCSNYIIPNATAPSRNIGMPSGHSQVMGFLLGYILYKEFIKNKSKKNKYRKKIIFLTSILLGLLAMVGRLNFSIGGKLSADPKGCHTFLQCIIGMSIGLFMGATWCKFTLKN